MPKKTWVRKEKIVDVGKCKYCNQSMTSENTFIPIGRLVRNKYQYQNAHYDCANNPPVKSNFDW